MSRITKLSMKNIRCFENAEIDIRPITLLVGENSTGKTTALACLHAMGSFLSNGFREDIDFNVAPYNMGAFRDIIRKSRPLLTEFELSVELKDKRHSENFTLSLMFNELEKGAEPHIKQQTLQLNEYKLNIKRGAFKELKESFEVQILNENEHTIRLSENSRRRFLGGFFPSDYFLRNFIMGFDMDELDNKNVKEKSRVEVAKKSRRIYKFLRIIRLTVESVAPIRAKPERTYNPIKENQTAEGSEMPMVFNNLSFKDKTTWDRLRERLVKFGKASELFTDVKVKRLGKASNAPFQIILKIRGPDANLVDVGYGVNQILPILNRIFSGGDGHTFLIQQPELHLHPKAQAAFASLLAQLIKLRHAPNFIIETHSDYIIDRLRIEIGKENIKPDDVGLTYFEPVGSKVKTHNISFDGAADLHGVPEGYRNFFIEEMRRRFKLDD